MKKLFQNLMLATILLYASTSVNAQAPWVTNGNTHPPGPQVDKLGTLNAYDVRIITNDVTRMTVKKNNGRVGIGTISPINKLDVYTQTPEDGIRVIQKGTGGTGTSGGAAALHLDNGTTGGLNWTLYSMGVGNTNEGTGNFVIASSQSGSFPGINYTPRLIIEKTFGNVGIGTLSPAEKLEVAGGDARINSITVGLGGGFINTNAVLGYKALGTNITGTGNTAVGYQSLISNTTGANNTATGYSALYFNNANNNTAHGYGALFSNQAGNSNTATGEEALYTNIGGNENVSAGYRSLYNSNADYNTATGASTLYQNINGNRNTAVGYKAIFYNISGSDNTALGYAAGVASTSTNLTNATAIGANALVCSSNMMVFGDAAVTKWGLGICPAAANIIQFSNTTATLTTGGVWTNASDKKLKNSFEDLDQQSVLDKINQLKIQRWHYIADLEPVTHIGPMAQDFYAAFKVGNDTTISTIDPAGVALIGIQELSAKNEELTNQVDDLTSLVYELKAQLQSLDVSLSQCCASHQQSKAASSDGNDNAGARLFAITPNPFSQKATITFSLPADASIAQLSITDANGKVVSTYSLSAGSTEQIINANKLSAGVYQYSLIVNGKMMDSKQMVIVK
ncbi:MAG: tail fiber domain-containing protein [Chitinophagales bacterium]|nr:tail fiber domain-containing protein [Chitinophagaceae bacterium]MBP9881765.1 tail fiber domain-containing protein [Chitinophagales bacterium]